MKTVREVLAVAAEAFHAQDAASVGALADMLEEEGMGEEARCVRMRVADPPDVLMYTLRNINPFHRGCFTVTIRVHDIIRKLVIAAGGNRTRHARLHGDLMTARPATADEIKRLEAYKAAAAEEGR